MTDRTLGIDDVAGATTKAFELVTELIKLRFEQISTEERKRLGENIIDSIFGDPDRHEFAPILDKVGSKIIRCIFDIMKGRTSLEHHTRMITRNPYKKFIPDADYIDIVVHSFYETAYLMNERLRQLSDLVYGKKDRRVNARTIRTQILQQSNRKTNNQSIFDRALGPRGSHIHDTTGSWPGVDRLSSLQLYSSFDVEVVKKVAKLFIQSHLNKCRKDNKQNFENVMKLAYFGTDAFFYIIYDDLKAAIKKSREVQARASGLT